MTFLLLLAVICFAVAVVAHFVPKLGFLPWIALGLFFWALTAFLPSAGYPLH
jgi:hypothetical protein